MVNHKRPVNLELQHLHYPPMAIVSILHRISGLILFLLLPFMLYYLGQSLASADSFDLVRAEIMSGFGWWVVFLFGAAWVYHVAAGIRHMVLDLGIGESLKWGRLSALFVLGSSLISILFLGLRLW